jgi:S-adenosyl-L-methionine hydrolase (adenosine-forming)
MARPIIALLTDFGLRDHYVAAMKGVVLGICPDATLLDITHDVPPQDILAGALELEAVVGYLPAQTTILAVVDPGVGSSRRGVAIETANLRFAGPDNGLFSLALKEAGESRAFELTNPRFARETVSRTFEGRDRFAPAAAWLASGTPIEAFGPAVADLVRLTVPRPRSTEHDIEGVVLRVDHFGNLVTNIAANDLASVSGAASIHVAGAVIDRLSHTYAERASGALCALVGSTGRLEISVSGGNAAALLGASRGTPVHVRSRPRQGSGGQGSRA